MVSPVSWIRSEFWGSDKGLVSLLVLIVITIFVGAPLQASGVLGHSAQILADILLGGIVITGGIAVGASRRTVTLISVLVVVFALEEVLIAGDWKSLASPLLSMSLFLVLLWLMVVQVFRPGSITWERILGAIAVYLLLALVWANLYTALAGVLPDSFGGSLRRTGLEAYPELVYFSMVTITTTGYGDISPVHPVVRSLANMEGMIGVLYPSIFIARLLSLQGRPEPESSHKV
jgi:voltage-gated potassium channel Kch